MFWTERSLGKNVEACRRCIEKNLILPFHRANVVFPFDDAGSAIPFPAHPVVGSSVKIRDPCAPGCCKNCRRIVHQGRIHKIATHITINTRRGAICFAVSALGLITDSRSTVAAIRPMIAMKLRRAHLVKALPFGVWCMLL